MKAGHEKELDVISYGLAKRDIVLKVLNSAS